MALMIPRPPAEEAAPSHREYLAEVSDEPIGRQLSAQADELGRLVGGLSDAAARRRYAPGKWSVKEVVGHLSDAERILAYRLLRIARGDATPLPGFDENAYASAAGADERPAAELLAEFAAVRRATAALVEGVGPDCWGRMGNANGAPVSARALAYVIVGHVAHHLRVLRERYGLGHTGSGRG